MVLFCCESTWEDKDGLASVSHDDVVGDVAIQDLVDEETEDEGEGVEDLGLIGFGVERS